MNTAPLSNVTTRAVCGWKVKRGEKQWTARRLGITAGDLAAAGIVGKFVSVEIRDGAIVITPDPTTLSSSSSPATTLPTS